MMLLLFLFARAAWGSVLSMNNTCVIASSFCNLGDLYVSGSISAGGVDIIAELNH